MNRFDCKRFDSDRSNNLILCIETVTHVFIDNEENVNNGSYLKLIIKEKI